MAADVRVSRLYLGPLHRFLLHLALLTLWPFICSFYFDSQNLWWLDAQNVCGDSLSECDSNV